MNSLCGSPPCRLWDKTVVQPEGDRLGTAGYYRMRTNGVAALEMASIAARRHFRINAADLPFGEFRPISRRGAMLLATVRVRWKQTKGYMSAGRSVPLDCVVHTLEATPEYASSVL